MKDNSLIDGEYLFTIDSLPPQVHDTTLVNEAPEHKSFNFIKLYNGQFALQPNNRIIWKDPSLVRSPQYVPDFDVRPEYVRCENSYPFSANEKWNYDDEELRDRIHVTDEEIAALCEEIHSDKDAWGNYASYDNSDNEW